MKKILLIVLSLTILFVALAAPSCPKKPDGTVIKPSETLTAARSFAIFPVAISAGTDVIEVLRADGDWSAAQAQKANALLDEAQRKLDATQKILETDQLAVESARQVISSSLDLLEQGIRDGTFSVKNASKQIYFSSLITLARGVVTNIYQVADALQPLPKELESLPRQQESLTVGGVAAIINIAAGATLEIKTIRDETNVKTLWQRAKDKSAAVHILLASRK